MPASASRALPVHERTEERNERFQARLSTRQKQILEVAAAIEGRTLSDFVLTHAQEAAQRTMREQLMLSLSERDSLAFIGALLSPWRPSQELREEIQQMRDHLGDE